MPLTDETRRRIHDYLIGELSRYVKEKKSPIEPRDIKPFHARLLPSLFAVHLSERSFSTRSGSWWQQISKLVGEQYHKQAVLQHRVDGNIKAAAAQHIDEILRQLNTSGRSRRRPNRYADIAEVQTVQSPNGEANTLIADLYIETRSGNEMFFEIKTPQPNKDTSKAMKSLILRVAAFKKGLAAEAYAATAYNPYGDGNPYIWGYARQFLEIGEDMLIGRAFWEKIGDAQTYDELLKISESVGEEITDLILNLAS